MTFLALYAAGRRYAWPHVCRGGKQELLCLLYQTTVTESLLRTKMLCVSFARHVVLGRKSTFNGEIGINRTEDASPPPTSANTMLLGLLSETLSEELTTYTVCVWKGLSPGLSLTTKASQDWLIPQMRQT